MVSNDHLVCWCEELAEGIETLKNNTDTLTIEEKLTFISHQYNSLYMLVNVLKGNTLLVGFPFRMVENNRNN